MKLTEYLKQTNQTVEEFARVVSPLVGRRIVAGTLRAISYGGGCRSDVARGIILATQGIVSLDDLVREKPVAARKPRAPRKARA